MKKTFKIIGAFVGLILLISVICLALILSKSTDRTAENSTDIKTILVLGSRINQNKKPAKITQERLDAALLLAKNNPQAKIIVSGAKGADEPVSEDKAGDTAENIAYSKKYFDGKTVIVTSDFHLYRALYLAKHEGVKVEGFAAKTKVNNLLYYPNYYGHEILGLTYAFVFGKG